MECNGSLPGEDLGQRVRGWVGPEEAAHPRTFPPLRLARLGAAFAGLAGSDYHSHPASAERSARMMGMPCGSIVSRHLPSLPRPRQLRQIHWGYVGSRPNGRDAIPALYRPAEIRQ
jgi:hypothetical protein